MAALTNSLSATYQQSGGANNKSVRPETHQLVGVALSLGGGGGIPAPQQSNGSQAFNSGGGYQQQQGLQGVPNTGFRTFA